MVSGTNPFKPTAGVSPPELIGRGALLDGLGAAIPEGPGSPGRLAILSGPRGVGKTVMLNEIAEVAAAAGWRVIELTAAPGLLTRVDLEAGRILRDELPPARARLTGVSISGVGGISLERSGDEATDTRATLTALTDVLAARGSGLMVTVDEVHAGPADELRDLAILTQHLMREDREFALVMAGLPSAVSGLLNNAALTFLRRADRHELGGVDVVDVEIAYEKTIRAGGRTIGADLARRAARASMGYPYLVQLIGYHVWNRAADDHIDDVAIDRGIADALERLHVLVHETALKDLSDADRRFLRAMAEDESSSQVADLARRLAKDRYWVNNYRRRLIAARVIEEAGRGRVRFSIPYLRDYLRAELDA